MIKNFFKLNLKNHSGFTIVEILLAMIITMIIFGIAAETIFQQANTYFFVSNRKSTVADMRHALNNISSELIHIESDDITDISSTNINFTDVNGSNSSYNIAMDGYQLSLYKGNAVILPNIDSFTIEYQDGLGNDLDPINDNIDGVVRIKLTVTTEGTANEGDITLSTTIVPRSFLGYSNFQ